MTYFLGFETIFNFKNIARKNNIYFNVKFLSLIIKIMPKFMRVVVIGAKKVGKTAILKQLANYCDITKQVLKL